MKKSVIFDMDGLLIDSEPVQSRSLEIVLQEYGKTPQFKENGLIHTVGLKGDETWEQLKEQYNIEEETMVLRKKRRVAFLTLIQNGEITLMPGVIEVLNALEKEKIVAAIASNSIKEHIIPILQSLKIEKYFVAIASAEDGIKAKPEPDIYLKASELLKLTPGECVVLEDSSTGVLAGKKAGMTVIAVPSRYTNKQDFSLADKIIASLNEFTFSFFSTF
jgi:HAD superfamily hydrolase (TIGR01509 family)